MPFSLVLGAVTVMASFLSDETEDDHKELVQQLLEQRLFGYTPVTFQQRNEAIFGPEHHGPHYEEIEPYLPETDLKIMAESKCPVSPEDDGVYPAFDEMMEGFDTLYGEYGRGGGLLTGDQQSELVDLVHRFVSHCDEGFSKIAKAAGGASRMSSEPVVSGLIRPIDEHRGNPNWEYDTIVRPTSWDIMVPEMGTVRFTVSVEGSRDDDTHRAWPVTDAKFIEINEPSPFTLDLPIEPTGDPSCDTPSSIIYDLVYEQALYRSGRSEYFRDRDQNEPDSHHHFHHTRQRNPPPQ